MKRKETCALSLFVIIAHPPTVCVALSISSSLHTCPLQRPLDRCKPQSGWWWLFQFLFSRNTKTKKKTKMCGDVCETGSVDLGGWMNATYLYIYGPFSFFFSADIVNKKSSGS